MCLCMHILNVTSISLQDSVLDKKLKEFWELDGLGIRQDEDSVYSPFVKDVKFQDGRFYVHLPWRETHPLLPDNFDLSKKRLFSLLKRLRQFPNIYILNQYDATIRDQVDRSCETN